MARSVISCRLSWAGIRWDRPGNTMTSVVVPSALQNGRQAQVVQRGAEACRTPL